MAFLVKFRDVEKKSFHIQIHIWPTCRGSTCICNSVFGILLASWVLHNNTKNVHVLNLSKKSLPLCHSYQFKYYYYNKIWSCDMVETGTELNSKSNVTALQIHQIRFSIAVYKQRKLPEVNIFHPPQQKPCIRWFSANTIFKMKIFFWALFLSFFFLYMFIFFLLHIWSMDLNEWTTTNAQVAIETETAWFDFLPEL